ncbi:MAG TPA: phosphatidylserine decarboxylase family protein [Cytophagales bacterium]|jgi:phosphatidylserine decarboxylase|nr:phosphatidylserine decarboxylase family protein [Cytophagales bacterium]
MTIHKEGRKLLITLSIILVLIYLILAYGTSLPHFWLNTYVLLAVVVYLAILQFFRNPRIDVSHDEKLIYAPADGKVVVIEKSLEHEYLKEERMQISIFMSPVNVHVNRNPVTAIIKYFEYHAGKHMVAWHPKSSTENERTTLAYQLKNGVEIVVRQIAGALARRIVCYVKSGDHVKQGEEFGFIKFGSRVDVFLPLDAHIKVHVNEKTKGGITVLAELK